MINDKASLLNRKYPAGTVKPEITDKYFNMRKKIEPVFHTMEIARKAIEDVGIEVKTIHGRGGTDGSRILNWVFPAKYIYRVT